MASPAAPSPGAPSTAQPAPGPAAPAPATSPDAVPVVPSPQTARAARPIPRLPGVIPDDEPFPPPPTSKDTASPTSGDPARGPDGRFVAAASSPAADADGDRTLEPTKAAPSVKFKFADMEFDSQELAEQNFKSLRGQFKPLQERAAKAAEFEQDLGKAAASARAWKAAHDTLSAELEAARSGKPADDSASQPDADVDWDLYAEIKKLATESGEPWKAEKWLMDEVRKVERTRLDTLLDEKLRPEKEREAREAVASHTETLFESIGEYVTPEGNPAFPELRDETASYEIGRLWSSLGLPIEHALTPQGAIAAVGLYRMSRQNGSQGKSAPALPVISPPAAPPPPTDAHAAAGLDDGRPTPMTPGNGDAPSAEAARLLAGLRAARSPHRAHLGFDE